MARATSVDCHWLALESGAITTTIASADVMASASLDAHASPGRIDNASNHTLKPRWLRSSASCRASVAPCFVELKKIFIFPESLRTPNEMEHNANSFLGIRWQSTLP